MSTTMVKLEQISREGESITCTAYVEDCKEPVRLEFHIPDGEMQNTPLPSGYEWCRAHLSHAKKALGEIARKETPETRRTVMWY